MSFRESLKRLTENVTGGLAATIMGYDGIPIDEYLKETAPFDLQLLAVEYANLIREVKRTVDLLENGELQEVSIATKLVRVLVRAINDEFFLVLVIAADGNYGKGRYLVAREALTFREQL
jgi:predicted regulator of Ras-like GTPase activity (Roadblock/LC7/MglB family)